MGVGEIEGEKLMKRPVIAGLASAVLVATTLAVATTTAHAATLFSEGFESGTASGWSKSGGSWSVVSDGGLVYRQSSTGSDAKAQAGQTSWAGQTVQARVKPLAWSGTGRFAGVLGRAQSMTSYYYLALTSDGQLVLGRRAGGGYTTLASAPATVATGGWYALRLEAFGSDLRGYLDGELAVTATDQTFPTGRIGLATRYASAAFDDVVVTDVAGPGPTPTPGEPSPTGSPSPSPSPTPSQSPSPTPTTPPVDPPPGDPDGFAAVSAWGQDGTSGGAGGATVRVDTATEFLDAIGQPGSLVIEVDGMITLPGPMHDVGSDKTILGLGAGSGITGGGLNIGLEIDDDITEPPANAVNNIIIRNLNLTQCPDDCLNVQMFSHHVWIDHNDLSEQNDGALDIKRGSSYVTVSWDRFHDSDKNMLVGHDDSNGPQDIGRLRVTYHHNWFDGSNQRNPRVRFGEPVHIYNNYYLDISGYGVASQMDAGVLVEGNYFDNVEKPTRVDVGGSAGRVVVRSNILVNSDDPFVEVGTVEEPSQYYGYSLDDAADIPAIVTAGAGTGRLP
jgi:pectate lyase